MHSIDRVCELLHSCGTPSSVLPPTELYCEGWMLRLVLDAYTRMPSSESPLKPASGAHWRSEVLLASRFLPRSRRDSLGEGWTHADGVIGHFAIGSDRGDMVLAQDATQFVVTEAKMFSPLTAGTRRAATFNQAARNVACMAHAIAEAGAAADQFKMLAFVVLAPRTQLVLPDFVSMFNHDAIARAVAERVMAYEGIHDMWHIGIFVAMLERIKIIPIAWEDAIADIASADTNYGQQLAAFYESCLKYNNRRRQLPA